MKRSISDVLETMFFLALECADNVKPEEFWNSEKDEVVVTKLNFSGPFSGFFILIIPNELALSLTANFMGEDEESITQDHASGTVKEILNMIAGNIFSNFDDQVVFDLDIPELIHFDEAGRTLPGADEEIFILINTLDSRLALKMVKRSDS
jgi:CheY-specific phosphatase CheX